MTDRVSTQLRGRAQWIILERPERLNALDQEMYRAMTRALVAASKDPQVRVVVFAGEGRAFCAGNDLKDFASGSLDPEHSPVMAFLREIAAFPKPVLALVHGMAVGIGTTLLLHCDQVIAASDAQFSLPFAQLGLVPEAGSSLLVPALVGHRKAFSWLVLGERFGAEEAMQAGLVNRVVPGEGIRAAGQELADRIAALPPAAVRESKALLRHPRSAAVRQAMAQEAEVFARQLAGPEAEEAMVAFFEKRAPDFSSFT